MRFFVEKLLRRAGALQNMDSPLVLLLLGTVNGELKTLQNRSKSRFRAPPNFFFGPSGPGWSKTKVRPGPG